MSLTDALEILFSCLCFAAAVGLRIWFLGRAPSRWHFGAIALILALSGLYAAKVERTPLVVSAAIGTGAAILLFMLYPLVVGQVKEAESGAPE